MITKKYSKNTVLSIHILLFGVKYIGFITLKIKRLISLLFNDDDLKTESIKFGWSILEKNEFGHKK